MRSRLSRRSRVAPSASGEGPTPSASSLARTNRSTGFRTREESFTAGGTGRTSDRKAQCEDSARGFSGPASASTSGQRAPWSIQARRIPTSSELSPVPPGGMTWPGSTPATSWMSRLRALSPGRITAPDSPPRRASWARSNRRPFICCWGPWQRKQRLSSSGATSLEKSTALSAGGGKSEDCPDSGADRPIDNSKTGSIERLERFNGFFPIELVPTWNPGIKSTGPSLRQGHLNRIE